MSGSAEFTIEDTPFSDGGYDTDEDTPVTLQLALAGVDVWKAQYSVAQRSKHAPEGAFTPSSGMPTTPGGSVTFNPGSATLEGAPHAFRIRCVVNDGRDKSGELVDEYTRDRILVVRNAAGLRAALQGELYEYDSGFGVSAIYDDFSTAAGSLQSQVDDARKPIIVRTSSGAPTLQANRINLLSGTVSGATLPPAADNDGLSVWVKKHNLGSINISRGGSDVIDGATTYTMAASYLAVRFVADGVNNEWLSFP